MDCNFQGGKKCSLSKSGLHLQELSQNWAAMMTCGYNNGHYEKISQLAGFHHESVSNMKYLNSYLTRNMRINFCISSEEEDPHKI